MARRLQANTLQAARSDSEARARSAAARIAARAPAPGAGRLEVACCAMPAADPITFAAFLADYGNEVTAVATVVVAFILAEVVNRALLRRGRKLGEAVTRRELSQVADTRLRLVRRLIFVTIIVIGLALALAQFPSVKRVATGVLASSALLGLVVGFAARQTLANAIAGVMLAITQPIRIGDLVTFEEETGEVEDIQLTYTYIRLDDGRRLIVPNERLAQSSIANHTVVDPKVQVETAVWLEPGGDASRALDVLGELPDVEVAVAEVDKEGIRLALTTWVPARERGGVAARLRKESLQRLRDASLSFVGPPPSDRQAESP
jgi:small-conductance mechanosensitive channel